MGELIRSQVIGMSAGVQSGAARFFIRDIGSNRICFTSQGRERFQKAGMAFKPL